MQSPPQDANTPASPVPNHGLALSGIAQVSMPVQDLQRAIGFYRDVLGLPLLSEFEDMAFLLAGSVRIMLAAPEPGDGGQGGSILYFDARDIEGDCAALAELGAEILKPPFTVHSEDSHEFRLAFFLDSEGNTPALSQWRRTVG